MKNATNLVNHIIFVLDESGSMYTLSNKVIELFNKQVEHLCNISKQNNQETRVTVFSFNTDRRRVPSVKCIIYDTDVLRVPSIESEYNPDGGTPMIKGVTQTISDMKQIPEKYGDHAFLMFVITDGYETENTYSASILHDAISSLPDNWTVGCLVPDQKCLHSAKMYGFPAANCQLWSTTTAGVDEMDTTFKTSTHNFMIGRSQGIRKVEGGLFKVDLSKIDKKEVQRNLEAVDFKDVSISNVNSECTIKDYVASCLGVPYVKGKGYYQLTKKETVQSFKGVCVRNKQNGRIYTGDAARTLLGLPNVNIDLKPESTGIYEVFIQSTSVNRKLLKGTKFLYLLK
jgi:hypothetical protein